MRTCALLIILWFSFCAVEDTTSANSTQATSTTEVVTSTNHTDTTSANGNSTQATSTTEVVTSTQHTDTTSSNGNPTQAASTTEVITSTNHTDTTSANGNPTQAASTTEIITSTNHTDTTSANDTSTEATSTTEVITSTNHTDNPTTVATEPISSTAPTTEPLSSAPTPTAPLPCDKKPCTPGAECINLVGLEFVCQCPLGLYYTTSGCQQGKLFPGILSQINVTYNATVEGTQEYRQLYANITQLCQAAFTNETAYKQTIILSVKASSSTVKRLRAAETMTSAVVSLVNMFNMSTSLNSTEVQDLIEKAVKESIYSGSTFAPQQQCETLDICDSQTTDCSEKGDNTIATCECKPEFAKKTPQDTSCSLCANCSQNNNKQCITKEGVPQCQCMINFYDKDGGCQECHFGYSGENCKDNYMVVIVAVAVVCGIVIVVLAGVLIYKLLSTKKKLQPERRSLLNHDYSATERNSESKSAANVAPREKIFPRVQTKNTAGQGGLARNADEGGLANKAYLPDQDNDGSDPSSIEMTTRSNF